MQRTAWILTSASILALAQLPDMRDLPKSKADFMKNKTERQGRLKPGDPAPRFALKERGSNRTIDLASFRGKKPVALVFGSYT